MQRGVLLIGGAGPSSAQIRCIVKSDDLICAADSGLDMALPAGIEPQGIVGDMDSISDSKLLENYSTVEIAERDKNESDTELGISWLIERGCESVVLIGGGEGRLDHTLALLKLFSRENLLGVWFTARDMIESIEENTELVGDVGSTISFFPIGNGPWMVQSMGLAWELDVVDWNSGAFSLSNRFEAASVKLMVESGRFILIRPIEQLLYHRW